MVSHISERMRRRRKPGDAPTAHSHHRRAWTSLAEVSCVLGSPRLSGHRVYLASFDWIHSRAMQAKKLGKERVQ